jgi:hypothetical protein
MRSTAKGVCLLGLVIGLCTGEVLQAAVVTVDFNGDGGNLPPELDLGSHWVVLHQNFLRMSFLIGLNSLGCLRLFRNLSFQRHLDP